MACQNNGISLHTVKVQGGALLSVGEAHNKLFPVPASAGKGNKGKGHALHFFVRLLRCWHCHPGEA